MFHDNKRPHWEHRGGPHHRDNGPHVNAYFHHDEEEHEFGVGPGGHVLGAFWRGRGRGGHGGGPGNGGRAKRGALRYVLLDALRDGPKHGYEIIKAFEERTQGQYGPSPGTV